MSVLKKAAPRPTAFDAIEAPARDDWRAARAALIRAGVKVSPGRRRRLRSWDTIDALVQVFGWGLKLAGLHARGRRNALDLTLRRLDLAFPDLPAAFDGFRVLQLSDLHVDALPGAVERLIGLIDGLDLDLCVMTGDYRGDVRGSFDHILPDMQAIRAALRPAEGVLGILGNHDDAAMVEAFEALGIRMLVNESWVIRRGAAQIHLTGTDDVHYFYTEAARAALADSPEGFGIALVHSPELADAAAGCGFKLYLAGHTHGGQIALPGGRPLVTRLTRHRAYAAGLWRHGAMHGYTSSGVGTSSLPVRFNTRGEAVLITLRRGPAG